MAFQSRTRGDPKGVDPSILDLLSQKLNFQYNYKPMGFGAPDPETGEMGRGGVVCEVLNHNLNHPINLCYKFLLLFSRSMIGHRC